MLDTMKHTLFHIIIKQAKIKLTLPSTDIETEAKRV